MSVATQPKPSFTPYRKWGMSLNFALVTLLVLAVVVMVNYLARDYFWRVPVSARSKYPLSPLTLKFLGSLTNQVKVTVYYDKDESLYDVIVDLLNEYRAVSSKISFETVDYKRDPGPAQQLQLKYSRILGSAAAKNLVIFDCGGRVMWVSGDALAQVAIEPTGDKDAPYRRKLLAFAGERAFTSMLVNITSPRQLTAYFLSGHGERPFGEADPAKEPNSYGRFAALLHENSVSNAPISLLGTNPVPKDCNLLVVAGPQSKLEQGELHKIEQYLSDGGRMLVLFDVTSVTNQTGLEEVLVKWGVAVGHNVVADPEHTPERVSPGVELIAGIAVNPLLGFRMDMLAPRTISKLSGKPQAADAPQVESLVYSGPNSFLLGEPATQHVFPLAVAVEKGAIKNVVTERGTTRIVVVGDSFCFDNQMLERERNQDLAMYLVNWLLDRPQLLGGSISPRPVREYKYVMTKAQMQSAQWLLLGGLPGGVLVVGGLVWLRRRR
jgi:hypothetical protein